LRGKNETAPWVELFFVFIAFYFLLLGLRMLLGNMSVPEPLVGALLASLALTFFWAMRKK
jgi:hypothetical protein